MSTPLDPNESLSSYEITEGVTVGMDLRFDLAFFIELENGDFEDAEYSVRFSTRFTTIFDRIKTEFNLGDTRYTILQDFAIDEIGSERFGETLFELGTSPDGVITLLRD